MINYFDYQYAAPDDRKMPFRVSTELAPAPWNSDAWLLRIGIKGFDIKAEERPPANLVFLIDVSGSMQTPEQAALAEERIPDAPPSNSRRAIGCRSWSYAGSSGVVLEPTPGDQKGKIR
jgi:Ca-activated chloride channel family protein